MIGILGFPKDGSGWEYIHHPLRVMMKMDSQEEMIAAVFHDAVEDSQFTLDELARLGFIKNILDAIFCQTRSQGQEIYEQSMSKVKENALAVKAKLADLEGNMDIRRFKKNKGLRFVPVTKISQHMG
ncbi:MAG: GTP pyrophosphokinase [Desulfobacter sp.]|nr:GTP pyrophosphokinase [Desulfobacter sp.]WDP87035.1 MAG: GTP pyrophosphokinase [Desulfobacter sp.]